MSRADARKVTPPPAWKIARLLILTFVVVLGGGNTWAGQNPFPRPASLEPAVNFWRNIFATYSENQVVVHDDWYLAKVYDVLDFRAWANDGERLDPSEAAEKKRVVDEAKARVRRILLRLHEVGANAQGLSEEEQKIARLFSDVRGHDKFLAAADRVRSQSGLRERFSAGITRQSAYLPQMEKVFRDRGLPAELARMPLVESCFDVEAYSKVGAAGVWQFMPATGRQYMSVNSAIDERLDPMRATHAAAKHLSGDYESLGEWPLAITAYNHGRGGVARGVSTVGSSDIGRIVSNYRGPSFGFASRNFYAEFLAALDVTSRAKEHFGVLPVSSLPASAEIKLDRPMYIHEAARLANLDRADLIEMNPAFLSNVAGGRTPIPGGYSLRIPLDTRLQLASVDADAGVVTTKVREAPIAPESDGFRVVKVSSPGKVTTSKRSRSSSKTIVVHRVRAGQTLDHIARKYGTTVQAIKGLNRVSSPRSLQVGQRLRIPVRT